MPCPRINLHARSAWWAMFFGLVAIFKLHVAGALKAEPAAAPQLPEDVFTVRNWGVGEGLPTEMVTSIAQTPDGYLWFGTSSGLVRFDGLHFTIFHRNSKPALPSPRVFGLHVDNAGVLWVAAEDGPVFRYHGFTFERVESPVLEGRARWVSLASDQAGHVWLSDREGVVVCPATSEVVRSDAPLVEPRRNVALASETGTRHLHLLHMGTVARMENGVWRPVPLPAGERAIAFGPARSRGIWVIFEASAQLLVEGRWIGDRHPLPDLLESVTQVVEIDSGDLALVTPDKGTLLWRPGAVPRRIGGRDLPNDPWTRTVFQARATTLWIAHTLAGVSAVHRATFLLRPTPQLSEGSRPVKTVSPSIARGGTWVGTEGLGLFHFDGSNWHSFAHLPGLTNRYVWSVQEESADRVWVGTWGGGVFLLDGDRFQRVPGFADSNESIACLLRGRDGSVWAGSSNGVWWRRPDGSIQRLTTEFAPGMPDVRLIYEAPDGSIWFYPKGGPLVRYRDNRFETMPTPAPTGHIISLHIDERDVRWIGTAGNGLYRWQGTSLHHFDWSDGIERSAISLILPENRWLWIAKTDGVIRITRADLDLIASGVAPSKPRDLRLFERSLIGATFASGAQPTGHVARDGRLWMATFQGLASADPSVPRRSRVPQPLIETIEIDGMTLLPGKDILPGRAIVAPARTRRLSIRFSAPSYREAQQTRLTFRLDREPPNIAEAGMREATYLNLQPGQHQFEVTASVGGESASTSIDVVVRPAFWEHPLFRIGAFALALG